MRREVPECPEPAPRALRGADVETGVVVWDLPLSLVADTLLLPWTLFMQLRHGPLCPRARGGPPAEAPRTAAVRSPAWRSAARIGSGSR